MMRMLFLLAVGLVQTSNLLAAPATFGQAKLEMRNHVYHDQNKVGSVQTLYCGCEWEWKGSSGGLVEPKSCGFQVRKQVERGARIEWEHVVPAYNFGRARQCWQNGGRENCQRSDPVFQRMEADMHNLSPTVGELNADRSNFRFGLLPNTPNQHGACPFKVDFKQKVVEPREEVRGLIARIQFYMHDHYDLPMSRQQQQLYMAWDKLYPPTRWEILRDKRIASRMGHSNPFVTGERKWSNNHKNSGAGVRKNIASVSVSGSPAGDMVPTIRGNKNSKVYHLPVGCPSYDAVSERNIVKFQSVQQAELAGYRKAKNCK